MARWQTSKLVGGAAAGQLISLLVYPVLTRLYGPSDIGTLAVYTSLLGTVAVVASLRYEQAIPLPRANRDASALLILSLIFAAVTSTITAAVALLWPAVLMAAFDGAMPWLVALLLPAGVMLVASYQALSMVALRLGRYGRVGLTRASQSLSAAVVQIVGGVLGAGPVALVGGHLIGQSAGVGSLGLAAARTSGFVWPRVSEVIEIASRYRKFAYLGMPSALLNTGALLMPAILITAFFDIRLAGFFSLATLVLSAPVQLVGRSSAQVFFAESSRMLHERPAGVRAMLSKVTWRLAVWSAVPAIALAASGRWVFELTFGAAWGSAGDFASVLTVAYFLALISSPASQVYQLLERQGISLLLNLIKLAATILAFAVVPLTGFDVGVAVVIFSVGMSIHYGLVLGIAFRILPREVKNSDGSKPF